MAENENKGQASIGSSVLGKRLKKKREAVTARVDNLVTDFEKADEVRSNIVDQIVDELKSVGESEANIKSFVSELTA